MRLFADDAQEEELYKLIDKLKDQLSEERVENATLKAQVEYFKLTVNDAKSRVEYVEKEKKDLLEDLLVASGVKMSKQQIELLQRQANEDENEQRSGGQTRQWAQDLTTQNLVLTEDERNQRALQLIEDLEKEFENGGGLVNEIS